MKEDEVVVDEEGQDIDKKDVSIVVDDEGLEDAATEEETQQLAEEYKSLNWK